MKIERREIVTCVLLSIVTCGIYGIYWNVKLGKDAVHVKDINDDGLLEVLLMIFFPFVGFYLAEKKLADGCREKGIPHDDNSIIYLVIGLFGFGFVDSILMQNDLNKIADGGYDISGANFYTNPPYNNPPYNNPPYDNPPRNNPPYSNPPYNNPPYGGTPNYNADPSNNPPVNNEPHNPQDFGSNGNQQPMYNPYESGQDNNGQDNTNGQ